MLSVVIDCHDPERLAAFWSGLVGGTVDRATASADWIALHGVAGCGYLAFQRVPEPKVGKNRVHLDHEVDDLVAATRIAVELGAEVVGAIVDESTNRFQVLRDPEGNELCLVQVIG